MKKICCILSILLIVTGLCSGCEMPETHGERVSVITTVFPVYDWVKTLAGDSADVILLTDNGTDMHSYEPTAKDIIEISESELFIYIGGSSDGWVKDIKTDKTETLELFEVLGEDMLLSEPMFDGKEHHHDDDRHLADEHIWLSLKNAKVICEAIADKLSLLGIDCKKQTKMYTDKLAELDTRYEQTVQNAKTDTVLFADRFPFIYLTTDYSLKYYAAFSGCSSETDASFETVAFLASKADELCISTILITDNVNVKLANTVIDTTSKKSGDVLSMSSMQSVTKTEIENGVTYLSVMEQNLEILEKVLNQNGTDNM